MIELKVGVYKHYKGGLYQVIGIAEHTEEHQIGVVYISLDATLEGPRIRFRPLYGPDGFATLVNGPGEALIERFKYIGNSCK